MFGYFPEVPARKIRVSAPAPYKTPTIILGGVARHSFKEKLKGNN